MPLGIHATVDFAFKKIFGSPENAAALIGLLNAILDLDQPIESVEILNPFSYQEFAESKLIVLDVQCRDAAGRRLNVEMQTSVYAGLIERLAYYSCRMYVEQLQPGQDYARAHPAISICLLSCPMFGDATAVHHRFQMLDAATGRTLAKAIEVHTVELTKYNLDEASLSARPKIEQWAFLLQCAHEYDGETLRQLLPAPEFEPATRTLEVISAKTEDKQMYDQREKAQRDYEWALSVAAREEGREEGLQEGLKEGLQRGQQMGREEGMLAGRIQTLQELLGDEITADSDLAALDRDTLHAQWTVLQQRLRERDA